MAFEPGRITRGKNPYPPRVTIYSPEGFGKTTAASFAPKPIFIPLEVGNGNIELEAMDQCTSFEDVMSCLRWLYKNVHPYQTIVLDHVSKLEQIIHEEIRREHNTAKGDVFTNYGKGYKLVPPYFEKLLKGLSELTKQGTMIMLLGHSKKVKIEPPDSNAYDCYQLNCHELVTDMIFQWSDVMLFGNYQVITVEKEGAFNKTVTKTTKNEPNRFFYTDRRLAHLAKNRYDLPYEIPFKRPFSWDFLLEKCVRPSYKEEKAPVAAPQVSTVDEGATIENTTEGVTEQSQEAPITDNSVKE